MIYRHRRMEDRLRSQLVTFNPFVLVSSLSSECARWEFRNAFHFSIAWWNHLEFRPCFQPLFGKPESWKVNWMFCEHKPTTSDSWPNEERMEFNSNLFCESLLCLSFGPCTCVSLCVYIQCAFLCNEMHFGSHIHGLLIICHRRVFQFRNLMRNEHAEHLSPRWVGVAKWNCCNVHALRHRRLDQTFKYANDFEFRRFRVLLLFFYFLSVSLSHLYLVVGILYCTECVYAFVGQVELPLV